MKEYKTLEEAVIDAEKVVAWQKAQRQQPQPKGITRIVEWLRREFGFGAESR